jgi:hypothetical protein
MNFRILFNLIYGSMVMMITIEIITKCGPRFIQLIENTLVYGDVHSGVVATLSLSLIGLLVLLLIALYRLITDDSDLDSE